MAGNSNIKAGDKEFADYGLVDIATLDTTIIVELMYASPDNFVGEIMYHDITKAYLHPNAAKAILAASVALHDRYPSYNLKVCDAARPMSVQRQMYRKVRGTSKVRYVSNPANGGGLHNYGLAVDVTIVDEKGNELPMGTKVDHLGKEANIDREAELVKTGVLTASERENRELLRTVMKAGGFIPLKTEWWHFNLCSRAHARRHYRLLDF